MMSELYRLVYASKNLLEASQADETAAVAQILATSRRNNSRNDVTGALLFNGGAFAQVLEGPRQAVESTFERIQRDKRHSEVTVLQCGPVESRSFAAWSMGFVGRSVRGQAMWSSLATESGFDLSRLDGNAVFAMLHTLVLDDEGTPIIGGVSVNDTRHECQPFDAERIRAELPRPGRVQQEERADDIDHPMAHSDPVRHAVEGIDKSPTGIAAAVLQEALAAERQRTTDLRNALDAMKMALATSCERADHFFRERDLWARRAQLLATALGQEASVSSVAARTQEGLGGSQGAPFVASSPRTQAA